MNKKGVEEIVLFITSLVGAIIIVVLIAAIIKRFT